MQFSLLCSLQKQKCWTSFYIQLLQIYIRHMDYAVKLKILIGLFYFSNINPEIILSWNIIIETTSYLEYEKTFL